MALTILFDELTRFKESCDGKSALWGTSLESIMNATRTLVEMDDFRGATATNVKSYLTEVHFTVLWALSDIITELCIKLLLYKDGYYQIDQALRAKFSEDVLNDVLRFFQGSRYEFDNSHIRLQQAANAISDIMYTQMPSPYAVTNDYDTVQRDQSRLKEDLLNHESSHYASDFTSLDQMMADLGTFLSEALRLDHNSMNLYTSGVVAQSVAFCSLVQNLQTTEVKWELMGEQLQSASDREVDRMLAAQREADGFFQIITSGLEIFVGICCIVVSIASLAVTGGMSAPLAVPGIIGGVGMIAHGSSSLQEGTEMCNLGWAGNITDSPNSWLRDSVLGPIFGEENKQTAFKVFGIVSSVMGIAGSAGAGAWANAFKLGAQKGTGEFARYILVHEGKVLVSVGGSLVGSQLGGWVARDLVGLDESTARYVELVSSIAAGMATYKGVNALDVKFNWNGLKPPIKPSNIPDPNAKPDGKRTSISPKNDRETVRSLTRENEAADTLAKNGYKIEQNPKVDSGRKPDYRIEGEIFDCYSPKEASPRNIASNIAGKIDAEVPQTRRIVLNLDDWSGNVGDIIEQINKYPIPGLREVIVVKDGVVTPIFP